MVAENVKTHFVIMLMSDVEHALETLLVEPELERDFRRFVADLMEETIQFSPVDERKIDLLLLDAANGVLHVGELVFFRITDVIVDAALLEQIENIFAPVHSARFER